MAHLPFSAEFQKYSRTLYIHIHKQALNNSINTDHEAQSSTSRPWQVQVNIFPVANLILL
jgi:hypothetical protein